MSDRLVITAAEAYGPLGPMLSIAWPRLLAGESAAERIDHPGLAAWSGRWPVARWKEDALSVAGYRPHGVTAATVLSKSRLDPAAAGLCVGASKGLLEAPAATAASPDFALNDLRTLRRFGGPAACPVAACATGLLAVVQAARWVRWGLCESAVAGAADYSLNPLVLASYRRAGVLSKWSGDPAAAGRPFDAARCGFVLGEGCGLLAVEAEAAAVRRDVRTLAVLSGFAVHSDPADLVAPDPSGRPVAETVRRAVAVAGLTPREVDAVCCHGTGTRLNDAAEARGLRDAFGPDLDRVSCFSLKGAIGHTLGASGAVELAFCVRAVEEQTVPPHLNCEDLAADCPIPKPSPTPVRREVRHLLKLSFGFGGPVAAVVLSRP